MPTPLYLASPDQVAHMISDASFRAMAEDDMHSEMDQYRASGNGIFVWRAWRIARLLGDMTPERLSMFLPYFDAAAGRLMHAEGVTAAAQALRLSNPNQATGEGATAAARQENDYWLLVAFQGMTRRAPKGDQHHVSKAEAYRRLAALCRTSEGSIKQRILALEGRGQYAGRRRNIR